MRLQKTKTPLDAASYVNIGLYNWHRNGCCAMKPKGQKSYCIWGEGPSPFPGLGISYTTDIDQVRPLRPPFYPLRPPFLPLLLFLPSSSSTRLLLLLFLLFLRMTTRFPAPLPSHATDYTITPLLFTLLFMSIRMAGIVYAGSLECSLRGDQPSIKRFNVDAAAGQR